MKTKSEETKQYIIEKVAPLFNKYGYSGTSMSLLIESIGMTKGAIYGNFKDKEEIAIEAFDYNISKLIAKTKEEVSRNSNANDQLIAYIRFPLDNFDEICTNGGCPVLSVAADANFAHPKFKDLVNIVITMMLEYIANIIQTGIKNNEINSDIDPENMPVCLVRL